ncbi:phosphate ABC transporter permease PstA [Zongyangia sp. HA2173]|uniref:phosphate ABC transporter permease PstA n=1 Tax=Zongyangia sp. HA2173 TaxID=3133035 RepID=UPI0017491FB4
MYKKVRPVDTLIRGLIWLCAIITIAITAGIIVYILIRGLPSISWSFLTTQPSELHGTIGILPNIINTLYIVIITLLIATPIGIGSAIYLTEYGGRSKLVKVIEFTTETLAGIPSIIYGLFGFMFFVVFMKLQYSIIAGGLTLAIMVLPTIIRTTQEALKSVNPLYREAALGMGATRVHMIRTVLLPSAMPGIMTAVILSIGRIVGESAALIFTAGIGTKMLRMTLPGFFEHFMTSGATLTVQLYQYAMRGEDLGISFAIAAVLVIIVLIINFSTKRLARRLNAKN